MEPYPEPIAGPEARPKRSNCQLLSHMNSLESDSEFRRPVFEVSQTCNRSTAPDETFSPERFSTEASDHAASGESSGKKSFSKRKRVGLVVTLLNEKVSGRKGSIGEPRTDSDLMSSFRLEPFNQIRIRSHHFRSKLISKKIALNKQKPLNPSILFDNSNSRSPNCRTALDSSALDIDDMSVFFPR